MTGTLKKQLFLNLPYLLFVYLFDKLSQAVRLAPGRDASGKLLNLGQGFTGAFSTVLPSLHLVDLCIGAAGAVVIRLVVYLQRQEREEIPQRCGVWFSPLGHPGRYSPPYIDPVFQNNVILTQTERLTMSSRPKEPKYARNKTCPGHWRLRQRQDRFFRQAQPAPVPFLLCGHRPERPILNEEPWSAYRIKSLNLINFKKSMRYNPLAYIRSEKDILKLVNALILNTKGEGEKSSSEDFFWVKAERLYYSAPHRVHLVRGGAGVSQLHHPAGPHQRQRGAGE